MSEPGSGTAGLRLRVARGVAWTTTASFALQASRLVFGIVLARLLTPHEYGLAGMALVFSALVLVVSDAGLGPALVQRREITEEDRSTVFWTSVAIGVVLTLAGLALSGPVASFYGEPEVQPLFAAVSLVFVVTALGRAHAAVLQRAMAFRAIALRVMAATLAGGIVGIVLAARGYGAWALIGMFVANGVVTTVLLWVSAPWRPRFVFSLRSLRDLGGFGVNILGVKTVEYLNGNADKILVGRFLGSSALGIYNVAYGLVIVPFASMLVAILDTVFPALSRVQDDPARVASGWLRATQVVAGAAVPAMLGLVVVAPELVRVLLGERWLGAVTVVQVLALAGLVHSVTALGSTVLTAVDRTSTLLRFSVAEIVVVVSCLAFGLRWGVVGVAAGYLAATLAMRLVLAATAAHAVGVTFWQFLRSLTGLAQAGAVMLAVLWLAKSALVEAHVPAAARLGLLIVIGVAVYVPLVAWRTPELVSELRTLRHARAAT